MFARGIEVEQWSKMGKRLFWKTFLVVYLCIDLEVLWNLLEQLHFVSYKGKGLISK